MSGTPLNLRGPAPCLGQHNEYVLRELLGYSEAEITRLKEEGHIGTEPFEDE
jgi:crotonobetainyl-CoA:carnitine CoA-transferase CaiB-like acyl-CoA transferase